MMPCGETSIALKKHSLCVQPSAGAAGALAAASETAPGSAAVIAPPADGRGSCC